MRPYLSISFFHLQGQVLNQVSAWWMGKTEDIVPNALLSTPDPNISVMEKCTVFPVEFIVRGFMTGMPRCYATVSLSCVS